MSERCGRGSVRRRSVLGVSFCALLTGCGSGRTSGEGGASGECVPASEAMSSPSVSPSRKGGTTVDIGYFPEDYIVGEGLAVSPEGALWWRPVIRVPRSHRGRRGAWSGRRMVCVASISHECAMSTIQDSSDARHAPSQQQI